MSDISKQNAFELNGKIVPFLSLPRVSVVVACFNYGRFIVEALNSVAQQTYREFDCVVVDDASTDDSVEIIRHWISTAGDDRFKMIQNAKNLGQMGSFKAALAVTDGEFVAFLDADDVWLPGFLARHIEVHLNRFQAAGASCSDLMQVDARGRVLSGSTMTPAVARSPRSKQLMLPHAEIPRLGIETDQAEPATGNATYIVADFGLWHWSVTSGMLFRRPLVDLFLPASTERLRLGADIYLMLLCHCFTGSLAIPDVLGAYRRHGQNNFSVLPVLGQPGTSSVAASKTNYNTVCAEILEHLLDAGDRISAIFSPGLVRRRLRSVFRRLLIRGEDPQDPRIARILGDRRMFTDRLSAKVKFLRQRLT